MLAARHGFVFSPLQIDRRGAALAYSLNGREWSKFTLPDVTVWTAPGQHHEIKHKAPTRNGSFGLEVYRFNALRSFADLTRQQVCYTIHNHGLTGGRDDPTNRLEHWFTATVRDLDGRWSYKSDNGTSWVGGVKRTGIPMYYWPVSLWRPLAELWVSAAVPAI